MERNKRQSYTGVVVSDKMDKTIVVQIDTYKPHPKYSKRVRYSKKFKAHDEKSIAKMGDKVTIMSTKPLSKDKNFRLVKVVEEAKG